MDATAASESRPLETIPPPLPLPFPFTLPHGAFGGTAAMDCPTGGNWCEKGGKEGKGEVLGGGLEVSCFTERVLGSEGMRKGDAKLGVLEREL